MTNEEFWAKPKDAVYTTPTISKTGMVLLLVISACLMKAGMKWRTTHQPVAVPQVSHQQER